MVITFCDGFPARLTGEQVRALIAAIHSVAEGREVCRHVECVDHEVSEHALILVCGHDAPPGCYWLDYTSVHQGIFKVAALPQELLALARELEAVLDDA